MNAMRSFLNQRQEGCGGLTKTELRRKEEGGDRRPGAGGRAVKRLLQGRAQSLCEGNFNIA